MGILEAALSEQLAAALDGFFPASVPDAIRRLTAKRAAIPAYAPGEPRDGRFEAVNSLLVPLLEVERAALASASGAPMKPMTMQPRDFDVVATDMKPSDLDSISAEQTGSPTSRPHRSATTAPQAPSRPSLHVASYTGPITAYSWPSLSAVASVVETLGPSLCRLGAACFWWTQPPRTPSYALRPATLAALDRHYSDREPFKDYADYPSSIAVYIHGVRVPVAMSHGRFSSVDLLGQDFLSRIGAQLTMDYADRSCAIAVHRAADSETAGIAPAHAVSGSAEAAAAVGP